MWGFNQQPGTDMKRTNLANTGSGLSEYRLRTGFMHVPVPVFGFNAAQSIRAIGRSEAMQPWRLGTSYDRPIPRRIAEEAGVPRMAFGVKKAHVATIALNLQQIAPDLFDIQVARYAPALRDWPFVRPRRK
jgi:hypothetical protein